MRAATVFHPLYFFHARRTTDSTMLCRVLIERPGVEHPEWEPGVGIEDNGGYTTIWEGFARIQPNIDWRARQREFAGEFDATQAVRVQLGAGKNELGATFDNGNVVTYGPDPVGGFSYGDVVTVLTVPTEVAAALLDEKFTVRNALVSQNKWQHNLLCDAGTKNG